MPKKIFYQQPVNDLNGNRETVSGGLGPNVESNPVSASRNMAFGINPPAGLSTYCRKAVVDDKPFSLTIGSQTWHVELAKDNLKGLSETDSLETKSGMLFNLTGSLEKVPINMQRMMYPIDIIFISNDNKVTKVFKEVLPEADITYIGKPVSYFLEVNAGEAKDIKSGDEVKVDEISLKDNILKEINEMLIKQEHIYLNPGENPPNNEEVFVGKRKGRYYIAGQKQITQQEIVQPKKPIKQEPNIISNETLQNTEEGKLQASGYVPIEDTKESVALSFDNTIISIYEKIKHLANKVDELHKIAQNKSTRGWSKEDENWVKSYRELENLKSSIYTQAELPENTHDRLHKMLSSLKDSTVFDGAIAFKYSVLKAKGLPNDEAYKIVINETNKKRGQDSSILVSRALGKRWLEGFDKAIKIYKEMVEYDLQKKYGNEFFVYRTVYGDFATEIIKALKLSGTKEDIEIENGSLSCYTLDSNFSKKWAETHKKGSAVVMRLRISPKDAWASDLTFFGNDDGTEKEIIISKSNQKFKKEDIEILRERL